MPIKLYDLAGANPDLRFSPYCFRTKLALKHKGIDFETIPWRFTDKAELAATDQGRVPTIVDGGRWVYDSWNIALYLDEAYANRKPLLPDAQSRVLAKFVNSWCDWSLLPGCRPLAVRNVFAIVADKDKAYFRDSREKALGQTIEQYGADREAAAATFRQALKPAETMLADHRYLHGADPGYGDYALLGTLLWPYTVCPDDPVDHASNVGRWFDRMLGLFDGWPGQLRNVRTIGQAASSR